LGVGKIVLVVEMLIPIVTQRFFIRTNGGRDPLESVGFRVGERVSRTKMDGLIEMPFGVQTRVVPENQVLDEGKHWRHHANMSEQFVHSCICQISLMTCYIIRLLRMYTVHRCGLLLQM